ncbi:hypothetical protein PLICRDRAFT_683577 [Plicaturopsis crispa FD-325 SS-3]|nr:hypothetical protein PLICRDRAFT_683577 [Plicaturopsis crispa FD-325 SS-3]
MSGLANLEDSTRSEARTSNDDDFFIPLRNSGHLDVPNDELDWEDEPEGTDDATGVHTAARRSVNSRRRSSSQPRGLGSPVRLLSRVQSTPRSPTREKSRRSTAVRPALLFRNSDATNFTTAEPVEPQLSRSECIAKALDYLQARRITPLDIIADVLDTSKPGYENYRRGIMGKSGRLEGILDHLLADAGHGKDIMEAWMRPHALSLICTTVYKEMDAMTPALTMQLTDITPEYLETWSLDGTVGEATRKHAPVTLKILLTACQTLRAAEKNVLKTSPLTACYDLVGQMAKIRSQAVNSPIAVKSLFWWACGASRATLEVLYKCGLAMSQDTILKIVKIVADGSMARARRISRGFHGMCYDNINISTSIFTEQRHNGPSKVRSGTVAILYELPNATADAMRLAPILERQKTAPDLSFNRDIRPTVDQLSSVNHQLVIHATRMMMKFTEGFTEYEGVPELQHTPRRPMPLGEITKHCPVRASTVEEASVAGNIAVPEDELRLKDVNAFTRIQVLQQAPGLFHKCMNLIWALLNTHRGKLDGLGSLTWFFALLDKTRLGCEHPDYHTLLAALMQILNGIMLAAWTIECGFPTMEEFAQSKPSPEAILAIGQRILFKYATPSEEPAPQTDTAQRNLQLLTRDLLYVAELIRAISDGDFGRIEDMLGVLCMMFRGAGSNNYSTEILHFIHNLKYVWTPEFA